MVRRWLAAFVAVSILFLPVPALAAGNTVSLSPSVQDIVLSPAATTVDFKIQLFNNTSQPLEFELRAVDFSTLNQNGGLVFSSKPLPQGLAQSLRLSSDKITINGGSVQTVYRHNRRCYQVIARRTLWAVVARWCRPKQVAVTVSVQRDLSALLFIQTAGQGTRLGATTAGPPQVAGGVASAVAAGVQSHWQHTGGAARRVNISRSGQVIMRGQLSNDSAMVLPGSSRLLETNLKGNKYYLLPGKYDLDIEYRYDGSLGTSTYHVSFWYVPLGLLITCGLLLVVLLWLLVRWQRAALRKLFT